MTFSFALLVKSVAFRMTLLLFAGLNFWSWAKHRLLPVCCDQEISFGFPFPFHISGGIAGAADYYILGLLLDIAIALTMAILITWIVEGIRS